MYPFAVPEGRVTFERKVSKESPHWAKSAKQFTNLQASHTGTIEDEGSDMLQVCVYEANASCISPRAYILGFASAYGEKIHQTDVSNATMNLLYNSSICNHSGFRLTLPTSLLEEEFLAQDVSKKKSYLSFIQSC